MSSNQIESDQTKEFAKDLEKFCVDNNIPNIPLKAKSEALIFLNHKFSQLDLNCSWQTEIAFLKDFWAKNATNSNKTTLNDYQTNFLKNIKQSLIEENKDFTFFKDKTDEEKIISFDVLGLIQNDDKKHRDLVISLYYYFLSKYVDTIPNDRKGLDKVLFDGNYDSSNCIIKIETDYLKSQYDSIQTTNESNEVLNYLVTEVNSLKTDFKDANDVKKIIEKAQTLVQQHGYNSSDNQQSIIGFSIYFAKYLNFLCEVMPNHAKMMCEGATQKVDFKLLKGSFDMMMDRFSQFIDQYSDSIRDCISNLNALTQNKNIFKIDETNFKLKVNESRSFIESYKLNSPLHTPKSEGCYIATMAYGDYNHPQVVLLRNFRDTFLNKYLIGKGFVRIYYTLSPRLVSYFKNKPFLVNLSRTVIELFIKKILRNK